MSREPFAALQITGWPLQRIEGHGTGGGPDYLPMGKGLWALWVNFGLSAAVIYVLAHLLSGRATWLLCGVMIMASAPATLLGAAWLIPALD